MTSAVDMAVLFDHFDERTSFLGGLADEGHTLEARLLCTCYIEAWGAAAFPEEHSSRRRFVRVLRSYGSQHWLHAVSLDRLTKWLGASRDAEVRALGDRFRQELERVATRVMTEQALRDHLRPDCSDDELRLLDRELWGGSLASMAYEDIRNSAVHDVLPTGGIFFSASKLNGHPIPDIGFKVLYSELRSIVAELRRLSIASGRFCGHSDLL